MKSFHAKQVVLKAFLVRYIIIKQQMVNLNKTSTIETPSHLTNSHRSINGFCLLCCYASAATLLMYARNQTIHLDSKALTTQMFNEKVSFV